MDKKKIGIVGSINMDFVIFTDKLPKVGETVVGKDFMLTHGGKGSNEAVACSRLGEKVNLIGCLGKDEFSKMSLINLKKEKVFTKGITILQDAKIGVANIVVSNKNNQIIVSPGANALLNKNMIKDNLKYIKECSIVGMQYEVSCESLLQACEICKKNKIKVVLNPSPVKDYDKKLYDFADYIIVNELELQYLPNYDKDDPLKVLKIYQNKVILTQGEKGVTYYNGKDFIVIPAIKVEVLDTTGAGDTFLGAFMVGINNNLSLEKSIQFANICAGLKTTKTGAQTGMPTKKEIKNYLEKNNINIKF